MVNLDDTWINAKISVEQIKIIMCFLSIILHDLSNSGTTIGFPRHCLRLDASLVQIQEFGKAIDSYSLFVVRA